MLSVVGGSPPDCEFGMCACVGQAYMFSVHTPAHSVVTQGQMRNLHTCACKNNPESSKLDEVSDTTLLPTGHVEL